MNRWVTLTQYVFMTIVLLGGTFVFWVIWTDDSSSPGNESTIKQIQAEQQTKAKQRCEDLRQTRSNVLVGFSMDTLREERWLKDRSLFEAAIRNQGAEVITYAAEGDDALQLVQAEKLIQQCVDILVIVPHNAEATATLITRAHRSGIKVIAYDRLIKNADVDLYVSFDNERVGQLQAQAMISEKPQGTYFYIGGAETDNNAFLFRKGAFDVLRPFINEGKIKVVYDQWSKEWKPSNAKANALEALRTNNGDVDAIIAANDGTAGGVVEALKLWNLAGEIPVSGQDAELAALRRIVAGTQTMTVYKPINALAEEAAACAVNMARGILIETTRTIDNGKVEVPAVLLEPLAVHKANIMTTIVADGFHRAEDIFNENNEQ